MSAPPERGFAWLRLRVNRSLRHVGVLTLAGGALLAAAAERRRRQALCLPDTGFLLELDLEQQGVAEHVGPRGLAALLAPGARAPLHLRSVVEALHAAGGDERCKGLLTLLSDKQRIGVAQLQELRGALADFKARAGGRAVAVAYSDAFGEGGAGGTAAFYLATACDAVFIQPHSLLSATGLAAAGLYARGLLDRWRVVPLVYAREEYKTALSFLANRRPSGAEQQALRETLASLGAQVVAGIAQGRGLTEKQVRRLIDSAPLLAHEAAAAGLVDGTLYRDQALRVARRMAASNTARLAAAAAAGPPPLAASGYDAAAELAAAAPLPRAQLLREALAAPDAEPKGGPALEVVPLKRYVAALAEARRRQEAAARRAALLAGLQQWVADSAAGAAYRQLLGQPASEAGKDGAEPAGKPAQQPPAPASAPAPGQLPVVALLTLQGPIHLGPAQPTPPLPSPGADGPRASVASLPVVKRLRAAREDKRVRAVVLRVDSPGGSAVASEALHREVALLRAAGKPVVVSMGNAAASGAYYLAAPATAILAQPGTITGSIGVLAGKLVVDEALREWGVESRVTKVGANADAASPLVAPSAAQRARTDALLDATYATFKRRVEEGRRLAPATVARLAKGRVWTGEQAQRLGLVDQLGGLADAIARAKAEAGLPAQEGAVLVKEFYPERMSPLARAAKFLRSKGDADADADATPAPPAAPAAWATSLAAATLGQPLTGAEWALLQQQLGVLQGGAAVGPQCVSLDAERLAAAL